MDAPPRDADTGESRLASLLATAFAEGPALEANALIAEVRAALQREHGRAFNYEVPLLDGSWEDLCREQTPRFRIFLRSRGLGPRGGPWVFVSLFHADRLYFLRAEDFLAHTEPPPSPIEPKYPGLLDEADDPALPVPVPPKDEPEPGDS